MTSADWIKLSLWQVLQLWPLNDTNDSTSWERFKHLATDRKNRWVDTVFIVSRREQNSHRPPVRFRMERGTQGGNETTTITQTGGEQKTAEQAASLSVSQSVRPSCGWLGLLTVTHERSVASHWYGVTQSSAFPNPNHPHPPIRVDHQQMKIVEFICIFNF